MSKFTGKQSKGAARVLREVKRDEATKRLAKFDGLVNEAAKKENLSEVAARVLVNQEASVIRGYTYKSA